MEPELTGGTVATIIASPLLLVLSVALAWICFSKWRNSDDSFDRPMLLACWVAAALGAVATVDSRTIAVQGGGMEDKFVVKFHGNDQQYGVLDTRAAGLKVGDHLTITCVRIWQWSGSHGYDCNFVSLERAK